MSNENRLFKVGLLGPTRVGKTSLVTCLLTDGQRLLEQKPVTFTAADTPTRAKIANHRNELNGSLLAGMFNPGALSANEDSFTFRLLVDPGVANAGIMLELLDFPGGWLDDSRRRPEDEGRWDLCVEHIKQSSVLLVPIDATILMGAQSASQVKALPSILAIATVADVARLWAKQRAQQSDEPALLCLCPVKCESYFKDNGGYRDASAQLLQMVRKVYRDVLAAVQGDAPEAAIRYCPVDTIGCVEAQSVDWQPDDSQPGGYSVSATYLVRPPGEIRAKGIDDVFVSLCQQITEVSRRIEERAAGQQTRVARYQQEVAERREGWWRNFTLWVSGERQRMREAALRGESEAQQAWARVNAFERVVKELANRPFGDRTIDLKEI